MVNILNDNDNMMSAQDKLLLTFITVLAIISAMDRDWMWFFLALIGIATIIYPLVKGGFTYYRPVLTLTMIPIIAQVMLGTFTLISRGIDGLWVISLIFQTWSAVMIGYLLALLLDAYTEIILSKRWSILFSFLFAMMVSGFCLFFQFVALYMLGYPVFNYEIQGVVTVGERVWLNLQLMMPCVVATPTSILTSLLLRQLIKKSEISENAEIHAYG